MPVKRKVRDKPSKGLEKKDRPARPPGGKFAPIIEELGKMRDQLEKGPSQSKEMTLQEQIQLEIEGELLKKEEDIRFDFTHLFKEDPQALVEMVGVIKKYGDPEIMRDIIFAVETLFSGTRDQLPGGKKFWDDLRPSAAPIGSHPAANVADIRVKRLQAIAILRETILSYDIMSQGLEDAGEENGIIEEILEPIPEDNVPMEKPVDAPVTVTSGTAAPDGTEKTSPEIGPSGKILTPGQDDGEKALPARPDQKALPAPCSPEMENLALREDQIKHLLEKLKLREDTLNGESERVEALSLDTRRLEEKLGSEKEKLSRMEGELVSKEKSLAEKEDALLKAEGETRANLEYSTQNRAQLEAREKELTAALEETRKLHGRTEEDLKRLREEQGAQAKASERMKKRELILEESEARLEGEQVSLQKIRSELEMEAVRIQSIEKEMMNRPPRVEYKVPPELDQKIQTIERELAATKSELEKRGVAIEQNSKALDAEMERTRAEVSKKESELAGRESALAQREKSLDEQSAKVKADGEELDRQREGLLEVARQLKEREEELDRMAAEARTVKPALAINPETAAGPEPSTRPAPVTKPPEPVPAPKVEPRLPPMPRAPERNVTPPAAEPPTPVPVSKVRCPGCKNIIPVFTKDRPLKIKCDSCGKEGLLK